MRHGPHLSLALAGLSLAACSDSVSTPTPREAPSGSYGSHPASGEIRGRITPRGEAAVTLRSGPQVPIRLPPGFTLYPGATVISNTVVERAGKRQALLVFETPDPLTEVTLFFRAQAEASGVALTLDLGGRDRASIGGTLADGGRVVIAAHQIPAGTRVELSVD